MQFFCARALLCTLALVSSNALSAQEQEVSRLSLSGYGSLIYSQDDHHNLGFHRDLDQKHQPQRTGSLLPDSRFGVQANYRLTPDWEAVGQLVLRDKARTRPADTVEWAYLAWRPNADWQMRVGRVGVDLFLLSDTRNLGYSQTTIRPNGDFYGFLPLYSLDGGDITYRFASGTARWHVKAQFGQTEAQLESSDGGQYKMGSKAFWSLSAGRETEFLRLKAVYAGLKVESEFTPSQPLLAGLAAASQHPLLPVTLRNEAANYRNQISVENKQIHYISLGASYDDDSWVAQAELSAIRSPAQVITQGDSAYALLGRRFGDFLPYLGISAFIPRHGSLTVGNSWLPLLGPNGALLQSGAVSALNSSRLKQNTLTFGLRWDFRPQAALKIQWDRIQIGKDGDILWAVRNTNQQAATVNLFSAGIDWVF